MIFVVVKVGDFHRSILFISFRILTILMTLFVVFLVFEVFDRLLFNLLWNEVRQVALYHSTGYKENSESLVCLFVYLCFQ